jgi:hypothetical protein
LNNSVEQDHRLVQRRVHPGLGCGAFDTARRTLPGYEAMHMIRKGPLRGSPKLEVLAQNRAITQMFGLVASRGNTKPLSHSDQCLQHYPGERRTRQARSHPHAAAPAPYVAVSAN